MREVIYIEVQGYRLIGTYHEPNAFKSSRSSIGIFFSNFGWVPRNGHGSLGAVLADEFAAAGFHAFRIDMPGMGDSPGVVPDIAEHFGNGVRRGEQVPAFSAAIRDLMDKYSITKVIVAGICAPFINAVFSWGEKKIPLNGIIALDPDFSSPTRPVKKAYQFSLKKIFSGERWMLIFSGNSVKSRYFPLFIRQMLRPLIRLRDNPDNMNIPLVQIWRNLVSSGVPALIISAKDKTQHLYIQQVNKIALRGVDRSQVRFLAISGTDHTFMTGDPRETILREVRSWLNQYFPE
jgi:pimeloyl-ACP methyl ester carboxylesterase